MRACACARAPVARSRALGCSCARTHACARSHAFSRALTRAYARAHARLRALTRALSRAHTLAHARSHARSRALIRWLACAHARSRALARAHTRSLVRSHSRARSLALLSQNLFLLRFRVIEHLACKVLALPDGPRARTKPGKAKTIKTNRSKGCLRCAYFAGGPPLRVPPIWNPQEDSPLRFPPTWKTQVNVQDDLCLSRPLLAAREVPPLRSYAGGVSVAVIRRRLSPTPLTPHEDAFVTSPPVDCRWTQVPDGRAHG